MNTTSLLWAIAPLLAAPSPRSDDVAIPPQPEFETADSEAHGRQVAEYADLYDRGWVDEVSRGRMVLFDSGGDSVVRTFSRMVLEEAEKGDKIVVRFLTPAEIKGVAALTHEKPGDTDDNWLYLPANKRVRRISGANKTASFQGTEFTYEDLSNLEVVDYDWRFLEETTIERDGETLPVYRLEAKPNYANTGYSKIVVYYHKGHWRRERIEYFDQAQRHLKTQDLFDWEHYHDRFWRSNSIEMKNHQTGKRTVLTNEKVYLNLSQYKSSKTGEPRDNLDESRFTTQALQL